MGKHLYTSFQDNFTSDHQTDEIPESLRIAFSVREHIEKLFNTAQSWNSLLLNTSLEDLNCSESGDLKKFSERLTRLIIWSEPHISEARFVRWNVNQHGSLHGILLLKLFDCKPLRLHIKLESIGNNKVEFWT